MGLNKLNINSTILSKELASYIKTKKSQFKNFQGINDVQKNAKKEIEDYLSAVFSTKKSRKYNNIEQIRDLVQKKIQQDSTSILNTVKSIDYPTGSIQMTRIDPETKTILNKIKKDIKNIQQSNMDISSIIKQIDTLNNFLDSNIQERQAAAAQKKIESIKTSLDRLKKIAKGEVKSAKTNNDLLKNLLDIIDDIQAYNQTVLSGNILEYVLALMPIAIYGTAITNANDVTKETIKQMNNAIATNQLGGTRESITFTVPTTIDGVDYSEKLKEELEKVKTYTYAVDTVNTTITATNKRKSQIKIDVQFDYKDKTNAVEKLNISAKHVLLKKAKNSYHSIHLVNNSPLSSFLDSSADGLKFTENLFKTSVLLNNNKINENNLNMIKKRAYFATLLTVAEKAFKGTKSGDTANMIIIRDKSASFKKSGIHIYFIDEILKQISNYIDRQMENLPYMSFYLNDKKMNMQNFIDALKSKNSLKSKKNNLELNNTSDNLSVGYANAIARIREMNLGVSLELSKYIQKNP